MRSRDEGRAARRASAIWHDVECGGYEADLELWKQLADEASGPILELGCGTGRAALHLARRANPVRGLDLDASLVAAFNERVGGLPADAVVGDARDFESSRRFGLVLAPMQVVQLFASEEERLGCLRCIEDHLLPGGLAAFAIVEEMPEAVDPSPPLPDVRETDGWVYSSLPLETVVDDEEILVRRLRQIVSPGGELSEEVDEVRLTALTAEVLEREAAQAGLRPAGRRAIPPTDAHVGSTVVLLERGA
jgi:SAM-dependent methyltransferase